jgi:long-chain fatty acid transport protein
MQSSLRAVLGVFISCLMVSESWALGSTGLSTGLAGAKALGQGNAFVGQADDPTALYYNPAGITQLKGLQVSVGAAGLTSMTERSGAGVPKDKMKEQLSVLPNFYATGSSLFGNENLAAGVGLSSPFGLTTDWAPTGSMRYVATKSKFEMVNVNPNIAYQIDPKISLALGANYVNLFNTAVENKTNLDAANGGDGSPDGNAKLSGHGSGWGYNVGMLYKPVERHSMGVSYRSQVNIPIKGSVELTNLSANTQANYNFAGSEYEADAKSSFVLPQSVTLGYAFKANEKWTFLADYEWTQWNVFQSQDVAINETDNSGGFSTAGRLGLLTGNGTNETHVERRWHNVSSFGLGANFKPNETWQWRGGYAFFEKTVPNDTFSPDIPDASLHMLSAGLSHAWESIILDFAFNGYFYVTRSINNTVGNSVGASVNGDYSTFVPALTMNLTYKFGK